ncbi:head-tail adaptor protein [Labrenzia sp. R4_1]|uniref:head-tail adaptor protein n=1 Tax=Labrenzia sp. R4_1 TaxID=2821106 RepID=UPI001ADA722F|nr:head-tail adaptor protein [Labrenzia sp. R4_1]MBO9424407.1 head-tail adaptor protein [Labrenzia sp. R4_1]
MRAGAYRVPVILQRPLETRSASGDITTTYEAAGSVFAALRLKSQSERFADSRSASSKTWEIRLRPFSGLAGGWRILFGTRVLRVLSVCDPTGLRRELLCETEEESP